MKSNLAAVAAALLAFSGVPTSAQAAGIAKGPYVMMPTTTTMTVCWVSDSPVVGQVNFSSASGGAAARDAADTTATVYHRVTLKGLKPYTRYSYTVTCDGQTSAPASFTTAAPPAQPFRFVAYGDNRTQPKVHAAVIRRILTFKPDFVLQSGDMVANGTVEDLWTEYFHVATPLLSAVPVYPALGNHEREGAPYFKYFGVERQYSFDYGNCHFVALDSNVTPAEFAAQEKFLKEDLAAHRGATWRIVFMHHTPYTCVDMPARREQSKALRARLEPILVAGNVQLVISGHDHTYQRHVPPTTGITYIVSGGGGAPLYKVRADTPEVKAAKSAYHDCEITVAGSSMNVRAVEPDGTVIDTFTLHATK